MKPIKIILAAAVIIVTSSYLTACSAQEQELSQDGIQRIMAANDIEKSVELIVREVPDEDEFVVELLLKNPEKKPITSAETWITYPPEKLLGTSIDSNETVFELAAPDSNQFNHESGIVQIGRATASPVNDELIALGHIHFDKKKNDSVMLDAFLSHTSVNILVDEKVVDVLVNPASPLLATMVNSGN